MAASPFLQSYTSKGHQLFFSTRVIIWMCLFSYPFQLLVCLINDCRVHAPFLSLLFSSLFQSRSMADELACTAWGGAGGVHDIIANWKMRWNPGFHVLYPDLFLSLMSGRHALMSLKTTFCHKYIFIDVSFMNSTSTFQVPSVVPKTGTCSKMESWPRIYEHWIRFCFKSICVTSGNKIIL